MILYAVHYVGPVTSYEPSIVSIHTTKQSAEEAKERYVKNGESNGALNYNYFIHDFSTDYGPVIYDYDDIDFNADYNDEEYYDDDEI